MSDEQKAIEDMSVEEKLAAIARGIPHVVRCLERLYRLMPDTRQCGLVTGFINKSLGLAKIAREEWAKVEAERAELSRVVLPPTGGDGALPPEEPEAAPFESEDPAAEEAEDNEIPDLEPAEEPSDE